MISYCAGLLCLAVLAAEDIRKKELSIYKLALFAVLALLYLIFTGELRANELTGRMLPGVVLLSLSLLSKESIGYGDGATVVVLGLWTGGFFASAVVCVGIILAGVWGTACLIRGKKEMIPFVPFLLLGMEVVLLYA